MGYYSASRVGVTLDGKSLFASNVGLTVQPEVSDSYKEDERTNNFYLASQGIRGELSLTYFLTGKDFVKEYFIKDSPISGNVGGLYFSSGYLTNYSFNFYQFQPVEVSANIQFYGSLEGDFSPSPDYSDVSGVIDYSNALITSTGIGEMDRLVSVSYEYNSSTTVGYSDGSLLPTTVAYGSRSQSVGIETYSVSGKTIENANNAALEITFRDDDSSVVDSFFVSGKVINLSTNVSVGENVYSSFDVNQNAVGAPPIITSFTPTSSNINTAVTINGHNFNGVKDVFFFDTRVANFEVNNAGTQITTTVPSEAITGPIKIIGIGGVGTSSSNFTVTNSIGVG